MKRLTILKENLSLQSVIWPLIILASADIMVLAAGLNLPEFIRTPITFWFLLVCPGMAFIRFFHFKDVIVEWTLAIALSISIDLILSEVFIVTHLWSYFLVDLILAVLATIGAVIQIAAVIRQRRLGVG